jgi:hypothetical protein
MPDVVEWKAHQRVETAAGHHDSADRGVPVIGDAHRGGAGLVLFAQRQHHRGAAGDEDAEEADQDEVVRGICQRAVIPAVADVQADVPDEAEQRTDDRRDEHGDRQRDPRRSFEAPSGPVGQAGQPGDLVIAVHPADPQQHRRDHGAGDSQRDDLADGGAATLVTTRRLRQHRHRLQRKLHRHPIPTHRGHLTGR